MYAIETFVGRRCTGGYLTGTHRYATIDRARFDMLAIQWSERKAGATLTSRRVIRAPA